MAIAGILNELIRKGKINTSLNTEFPGFKNGTDFHSKKFCRKDDIEFNIKSLRGLPLYDLCEEIIRIFELNTGDYDIYLQFFLDFVNKVVQHVRAHTLPICSKPGTKKKENFRLWFPKELMPSAL